MDYRKTKIEYIRYYTPGSEARVLQPQYPVPGQPRPQRKRTHQAAAQPMKAVEIAIDPLALIAIVVAVIMVAAMILGVNRLRQAKQELDAMAAYVQTLKEEKQELTATLESGYSLETLEKAALSLGMVPIEQVPHLEVIMEPQETEEAPEPTFVDKLYSFFTGLFA